VANDLFDRRWYEIANRSTSGNSLSDFRRRNVDFSVNNRVDMARSLTAAIKNNKTNHLLQVSEAAPFCKLTDIILADQAVNRCITFASPNLLHGIDGIRRWRAPQLAIIHSKSRFVFNSGLYHRQPYFVSRNGRGLSEGRHASGNKNHLVRAESLKGLARNDKMAVMNRIKCTAVDCDIIQRPTLNVQRSTFNQYPVVLSEAKHLRLEIVGLAQNDGFEYCALDTQS
jgi:hypothetical protein